MFPSTVVAVHHCMTELVTCCAGDKHSSTFPLVRVSTVSLTLAEDGAATHADTLCLRFENI